MRKMGNREFQKRVQETFAQIETLTASKGEEYAEGRAASNQHANFDHEATELDMSPEKVAMVYLGKHMSSIKSWVKGLEGQTSVTASEPMEGRFNDAILYLLLLKCMYIRRNYPDPEQNQSGSPFKTAINRDVERVAGPCVG